MKTQTLRITVGSTPLVVGYQFPDGSAFHTEYPAGTVLEAKIAEGFAAERVLVVEMFVEQSVDIARGVGGD